MALNSVGYLAVGWLGQSLGVRQGLWLGGGAIVLLSLAASFTPAIHHMDHQPTSQILPDTGKM